MHSRLEIVVANLKMEVRYALRAKPAAAAVVVVDLKTCSIFVVLADRLESYYLCLAVD